MARFSRPRGVPRRDTSTDRKTDRLRMVWHDFHAHAASPAGDTSTETKIARVPTGSAAPRAELGRACCPILIPRGGPRPWGSDPKIHGEQAGGSTRRGAAK